MVGIHNDFRGGTKGGGMTYNVLVSQSIWSQQAGRTCMSLLLFVNEFSAARSSQEWKYPDPACFQPFESTPRLMRALTRLWQESGRTFWPGERVDGYGRERIVW